MVFNYFKNLKKAKNIINTLESLVNKSVGPSLKLICAGRTIPCSDKYVLGFIYGMADNYYHKFGIEGGTGVSEKGTTALCEIVFGRRFNLAYKLMCNILLKSQGDHKALDKDFYNGMMDGHRDIKRLFGSPQPNFSLGRKLNEHVKNKKY